MPLSGPQTTTFFTEDAQMAIPAATVAALALEGITTVNDLEEITPEEIEKIAENFRSPGQGQDPIVFGAKSEKTFDGSIPHGVLLQLYRPTDHSRNDEVESYWQELRDSVESSPATEG